MQRLKEGSGFAVCFEKETLPRLCERLIRADPDILEIFQFGSSTYAPELARDLDLLLITRSKKPYKLYLDAISGLPFDVDIIAKGPEERIGSEIILGVYASGRALLGNKRIEEVMDMPMPTYDEAWRYLVLGDEGLERAHAETREWFKDKHCRAAFDALFDAARHAAMCFLCTENTRWGWLRRNLPSLFSSRFRQIINTLHITYWYEGDYPKERVDEEYRRWRSEVSRFIEDLERA